MTQQQLASVLGVSLQSLGRYERGLVLPQIGELAPLARRGVDLNWLATGEGRMLRGEVDANVPPAAPPTGMIDRARLHLVAASLLERVRSGGDLLQHSPQSLGEWLAQGYEWLGRLPTEAPPARDQGGPARGGRRDGERDKPL